MAFCKKADIHLISDEVYGLSVYDKDPKHGYDFTSVLSIDTRGLIDEDRVHIFYGMSKVCGIQ
jgi:1-aminocyclopropane-1-carboxylate synthase